MTASARSQLVARRTYQRPKPDGSFESWNEVVDRVLGHQQWLWERAKGEQPLTDVEHAELRELGTLLRNREGSLAGRTLWLGGTDVSKRCEATQFNCAGLKVETVHDVVDAYWLLLQGCGVGFEPLTGTLSGFTKPVEIEVIRSQRHLLAQKRGREDNRETFKDGVWTVQVGDSARAWAKAVGKLLAGKRRADKLVLDFTQVRPAGERLAGYGWICSGDETIHLGFWRIAELLNERAGKLLSRIDIMDVLNHLGTTLSSRRSAELALMPYGDPEWEAFASAKKDFWLHNNEHRQQSNNSLLFWNKPTRAQLEDVFARMQDAGGSEPGFINAAEAKRRGPWFNSFNPCVPGDTLILTNEGYVPIKDRVGKKTRVWDGAAFVEVEPFSTGVNPLVEVQLSDGTSLKCTPYHEWILAGGVRVMADELKPGDRLEKFAMPFVEHGQTYEVDAYSQGFHSAAVPVHGTSDYCLDWFAGLLDASGTRDVNGLQIVSANKEFLRQVRLMLTRLGVCAEICSERSGSDQFAWRLLVGNMDTYNLVQRGLRCLRLDIHGNKPQRDARRFVTVKAVIDLGYEEETYCFTNPVTNRGTFNGIVTGQCVEIILGNKSFCNLVEVNLSAFNGRSQDLMRAVRLLARANYRQTCVNLEDGILQRAWHENNEYLRLCGVGLTGIVGWSEASPANFRLLRDVARASAEGMADELNLPRPKAVTTIKPSGTLSKVMDTTEGIHKPLGKYIFNNVRFSKHDPLLKELKKANYKVWNDPSSADAVLVTLPISFDGIDFDIVNGTEVNLDTAVEQLERYKLVMQNYVDHNCSITVSYDPSEVPEIIQWLLDNWDVYVGVSFIYRNDPTKTAADLGYLYLPQEVVTKERYDAYVARLKPLNLEKRFKGVEDDYEIDTGGECSSGACPIR